MDRIIIMVLNFQINEMLAHQKNQILTVSIVTSDHILKVKMNKLTIHFKNQSINKIYQNGN